MQKESNFYKQIFRATSLFGSSQLLQFVFQVFSNKIIAVLLGPSGIGIFGFFNQVIQSIVTLTSFDLTKTATREIALLSEKNQDTFQKTVQRHFELALFISVLSSAVSVLFASKLSQLIFDDDSKTYWFYFLPIYFVFFVMAQTRLAVLQGLRATKIFAFMQLFHVVLSGLSAISFYYYLGVDGILWAVIANAFLLFLLSFLLTRKYFNGIHFKLNSFWQSFQNSKSLMYFGLVLSINAIIGQMSFIIIRWFLKTQSLEIVGFYEVSQVVLMKYLGMVFVAMAYDYYPKLTNLIHDKKATNRLVNQQIEMAITIVLPAVMFIYAFGPWVISILYTKDFTSTFEILQFGLIALGLKAFTYPLGFVALAHGNKKLFFKQELLADLLNVILSLAFFHYFGLIGLGLAMMLNYVIYFSYVYYRLYIHNDLKLTPINIKLLIILLVLCLLSVLFIQFNFSIYFHIFIFIIVSISAIRLIFYNLNKL